MSERDKKLPERARRGEIDAFLRRAELTPRYASSQPAGRLLFAMDATASREPTWDIACQIQGEMFRAAEAAGGLAVQLCYYGGMGFCHVTPWLRDSKELLRLMSGVRCLAGATQIGRVLEHAYCEARSQRINAAVFVGDCMEEDPDRLIDLSGKLGMRGIPLFVFHEGFDPAAAATFQHMARISGGAYSRFDAASANQLKDLLSAVATYATGGREALLELGRGGNTLVKRLAHQLEGR